ncbi:MAG TPA: hypothetical protein PLS49_09890, partial [Candidatus Woesebacteria bacterium]|nr:hypothetical protein [Candidatus Woesebacteria bacterium]
PMATAREWVSTYNYVQNKPVNSIDPDGSFDFVLDKEGEIYWDKNANDQATTKEGETYLGKTLTFTFNSYIDAKRWDVPNSKAPGDKLTSTITLTGNENDAGELTSISASKSIRVGDTPIGQARDFYPGPGGNNNLFEMKTTSTGASLNFEQHASVSPLEEIGLNVMGFRIVDVAQRLDIDYNRNSGNLSVSAATNIFPSATLNVNGVQIMQYNQPSFIGTHTAPIIGRSSPTSGSLPIRNYSYYPSKFYKR